MTSAASTVPHAPPPWKCKCQVYIIPFYTGSNTPLPASFAYSPLEALAPKFSSPAHTGDYRGGLGFAQLLRYTDTPVGPYDELAILPGTFQGGSLDIGGKDMPEPERRKLQSKKHLRITGIWVNSKASLVNGRRNWNIPKHLARFEFVLSEPRDPTSVPLEWKVFDDDAELGSTDPSSSEQETEQRTKRKQKKQEAQQPFFAARFEHIAYAPAFPFYSSWMKYLGLPVDLLQPPLPTGEPADLLLGTQDWKQSNPSIWSRRAKIVWVDTWQGEEGGERERERNTGDGKSARAAKETDALLRKIDEEEMESKGWPWTRRWHLAVWCQEATLELGEPEVLE